MRLLLVLSFIFLYLVEVIEAAPTTNTTDTITSDSFRAPSFTTRSLWTIVSSSVLTLFACIYTAIHSNISSPLDSPYRILRRRLGIMIMALIAPELVVTWAMRQWLSARRITRQFKDSGYPNVRPGQEQSEKKYSFKLEAPEQRENRFLRFCRFFRLLLVVLAKSVPSVLAFLWRFPGALARWVKNSIKAYFSEQSQDYTWTQTHSFFVLMGGFMLYVDGEPYLTLRPDYILELIRKGCIDVPIITAKQIHDKGKGNAISKGLIMLQVAWFIMQLITRVIYHLETTQLEVGTLAFAVLNFLTYAVWWSKPLSVQCPHPVYWKSAKSRPEHHVENVGKFDWPAFLAPILRHAKLEVLTPAFRPIAELIGLPSIPTSRRLRVPTFDGSIKLEGSDKTVLRHTGLLMATIFGGIHCMAWFFAFPAYQEQVLWRMSAIAITCIPLLCFRVYFLPGSVQYVLGIVYDLICLAFVILYITARAILLVLMFTTLRSLPPDAYKALLWTSLVPHL